MSLFDADHAACVSCGRPATVSASDGPRCGPCCPASEKPGRGVGVVEAVDRVLNQEVPT